MPVGQHGYQHPTKEGRNDYELERDDSERCRSTGWGRALRSGFVAGEGQRPIRVTELADFAEVGACGTAVVITPVSSITHGNPCFNV